MPKIEEREIYLKVHRTEETKATPKEDRINREGKRQLVSVRVRMRPWTRDLLSTPRKPFSEVY
jgi:hypothetical protein